MTRSVRWLLAAALLPMAACSSTPAPAPAEPPPAYSAADMQFINAAAGANQAEIDAGQLALQKTHSARVKAFAQKMINDHQQNQQQLQQLVQAKGVTPQPAMSQMDQDAMAKLQAAKPRAFDREYLHDQVAGHEADLKLFQDEAQNGADADLKQFASQSVPVIQQHLTMARRLSGVRH